MRSAPHSCDGRSSVSKANGVKVQYPRLTICGDYDCHRFLQEPVEALRLAVSRRMIGRGFDVLYVEQFAKMRHYLVHEFSTAIGENAHRHIVVPDYALVKRLRHALRLLAS